MKTCTKCETPKALSDFYTDKARKDGKAAWCKTCQAAHREANRERRAETERVRQAALRQTPEYHERKRAYRESTRAAIRDTTRTYYQKNRAAILERQKGINSKRRATLRGLEGSEPDLTWHTLAERDGMDCHYCGTATSPEDRAWGTYGPTYPTLDHIVPLVRGGTHTLDNTVLACGACNVSKGSKILDEWKVG